MTATIKHATLASAIWRHNHDASGAARAVILAVLGSALLTLSAQIKIPLGITPVPLTMQTFVVLAVGFALGWRLAATSVLLYLAQGAIGLPVFAAGGGVAVLLGPSGGYLFGFVIAAAVCGRLAENGWDRHAASTFAAMFIGNVIIYACGLLHLGVLLGWDKPILQFGLYPFLLGDLLKIGLAMVALPAAWKVVNKSAKH